MSSVSDIEDMYDLAATGYLGEDSTITLVQDALHQVSAVRERFSNDPSSEKYIARLDKVEHQIRNLQTDDACFPIENVSSSEVVIYRRIFGAMVAVMPSARAAKQAIEGVITKVE